MLKIVYPTLDTGDDCVWMEFHNNKIQPYTPYCYRYLSLLIYVRHTHDLKEKGFLQVEYVQSSLYFNLNSHVQWN